VVGENDVPLKFGASGDCGYRFEGLLDEIRIWDVARTVPQIAADMYVGGCGEEPNLVGYWSFEEDEFDQLIYDMSSLENHGTLGSSDASGNDDPLRVDTAAPIEKPDRDCDGYENEADNCPLVENPDQSDIDDDKVGDLCDNCPDIYNPEQRDSDEDGIGNACDEDVPGLIVCPALCLAIITYWDVEIWGTIDNVIMQKLFEGIAVSPCHHPCAIFYPMPSWANDLYYVIRSEYDPTIIKPLHVKIAAPVYNGSFYELEHLYEWSLAQRGSYASFPIIADSSTGGPDSIYVFVDLTKWVADPQPLQEEYEIVDGECLALPGFLVGTIPFEFDPYVGPEESPFSTDRYTGGVVRVGDNAFWDAYACGDADSNGIVNISDAVYLIGYIFGGGPPPQPLPSGDVDCNTVVNVSDIVYLISFVFGDGYDPCDTNGDGVPDC
jgi:hypothetical protein